MPWNGASADCFSASLLLAFCVLGPRLQQRVDKRSLRSGARSDKRKPASKNPDAFSLMVNRRRACQRPRSRYTKDGPFKDSRLPASRHLVFSFLAGVTYASRPCCFYLLVFSPRRFKQRYGVYANGQKKAGAPTPANPIYKRKPA